MFTILIYSTQRSNERDLSLGCFCPPFKEKEAKTWRCIASLMPYYWCLAGPQWARFILGHVSVNHHIFCCKGASCKCLLSLSPWKGPWRFSCAGGTSLQKYLTVWLSCGRGTSRGRGTALGRWEFYVGVRGCSQGSTSPERYVPEVVLVFEGLLWRNR